jgi:hypothetical protein
MQLLSIYGLVPVGRCAASGGAVLLCLHVSGCELRCVHDILPRLPLTHFGGECVSQYSDCGIIFTPWMGEFHGKSFLVRKLLSSK